MNGRKGAILSEDRDKNTSNSLVDGHTDINSSLVHRNEDNSLCMLFHGKYVSPIAVNVSFILVATRLTRCLRFVKIDRI